MHAPELPLHRVFEAHARAKPEAIALSFRGAHCSYAQLNQRADALARQLADLGIGRGDRVALALERSDQGVASLLGILKTGAAYVPIDPSHPADWQAAILADCEPAAVVGQLRVPHPGTVNPGWWTAPESGAFVPAQAVQGSDPMYLIYTSGSTGQPKGVLVSHANVARLFPATAAHLRFDAQDVWTQFHSMAFGFSVWEIWGALAHGGRLLIVPPELTLAPARLLALLASEGVTVLSQTPTAFRQLARALGSVPPALPHLRLVAFSGEALEAHVVAPWLQRFGSERPLLANLYALTETSGEVAYHRVTSDDLLPGRSGSIGVALPDVRLRLQGEDGREVAAGEVGELVVGGPAVALGYWRRPELQDERFGERDGLREYRTGDLACQLPDGSYRFVGRADRQVKVRGYRVELGAVEAALGSHPALSDAVVDVQTDASGAAELVAYVLPHGGAQPPSPAELNAFLGERLPHYALPGRVLAVAQLPMTPNGKLDWPALRLAGGSAPVAMATAGATDEAGLLPRIAAQWCQVLDLPAVQPEDDFFDLGGYSLLTLELTVALERTLGVSVTMTDVFEAPTLNQLTRLLAGRLAACSGQSAREEDDSDAAHGRYMRVAIDQARVAMAKGQPPYAACIVGPDGQVLAAAHNAIWQKHDATAHAEVEAIRAACQQRGSVDLSDCVLYSTAEPCSMCLSASVWAGIGSIVYAIDMQDEPRFGLSEPTIPCRTMLDLLNKKLPVQGGVLRGEMHALLEDWLRIQSVAL